MSAALFGVLVFISQISAAASDGSSLFFNGFKSGDLVLDGVAQIEHRLLQLSNASKLVTGHAFYPTPFVFKDSSVVSFSTQFVFQIEPIISEISGQGLAFVVAPTKTLSPYARGYIGLFNESNNGNSSNHVFAIEFDTIANPEFNETDGNHVGIDINSIRSVMAKPAGYYDPRTGQFLSLNLNSSQPIQAWVDYNGTSQTIQVAIAPVPSQKPKLPLLSLRYDLSTVIKQQHMYVGFSTAPFITSHYILGWSFAVNGEARPLNLSKLPKVGPQKPSKFLEFGLPEIIFVSLLLVCLGLACYARRRWKFSEEIEGWELDYISHRFKFKDLYSATKGFTDTRVLGVGGFGKVYKGVVRRTNTEVAVKRISHNSRQGIREFVAEIVSIGRLRHRNLVPLLGYCRRKGELLLVYEYMPNGSLDNYLHGQSSHKMDWGQRFHIIKGVASGLLYLHEEWEQVVIHRDIKPSNVLLDGKWNARLGDFGLARLHDHGADPSTTRIVGTLGYLAPEHTKTGKATTSSDVYGFGALLLEVATGRRPIEPNMSLIDWVLSLWSKNEIMGAVDPNLEGNFSKDEVELVLKLGLLCSHIRPEVRPTMRDIVMYLEDPSALPELQFSGPKDFWYHEGFDSFLSSSSMGPSGAFSISSSIIATGR